MARRKQSIRFSKDEADLAVNCLLVPGSCLMISCKGCLAWAAVVCDTGLFYRLGTLQQCLACHVMQYDAQVQNNYVGML